MGLSQVKIVRVTYPRAVAKRVNGKIVNSGGKIEKWLLNEKEIMDKSRL